jgi:hypothetical protein
MLPPPSRARFDAERGPRGALFVGSAQEVTDKPLWEHALFGHQRTLLQLTVGPTPRDKVLRAIEILGTEVAPAVRAEVARRAAGGTAGAAGVSAPPAGRGSP